MNEYTTYREGCTDDADEFQDFVVDTILAHLKIPICVYSSKKYQYNKGESANGVEIKFDRKLAETGNLYIETAEKAQPRSGDYAPSGIFRSDNTWLWIQGNREVLFIVPKKILLLLYEKKTRRATLPAKSKGHVAGLHCSCS